jgi:hypothetical protein
MLESVEVEELGGEVDISTYARKYPTFREGGLEPDGNGSGDEWSTRQCVIQNQRGEHGLPSDAL